jgi:hypothetical protein
MRAIYIPQDGPGPLEMLRHMAVTCCQVAALLLAFCSIAGWAMIAEALLRGAP